MKKLYSKSNFDGGFTLIELLIVLAIIGIISSITIVGIKGVAARAYVTSCKTDWRTVDNAARAFFNDNPQQDLNPDLETLPPIANSLPFLGYISTLIFDIDAKYKIRLLVPIPNPSSTWTVQVVKQTPLTILGNDVNDCESL